MVVLSVIPKSGIRETKPDGTLVIHELHYDEIGSSNFFCQDGQWYVMACIEGYRNPTVEALVANLSEPGACLDEPFLLVRDVSASESTFELKPVTDKTLAERLMTRAGLLG